MPKKICMFFKKAHGSYVPGDIAGFEPDMAKQLWSVAEKYDPKIHSKNKPTAEKLEAEMQARTSQLDEREAALAEREAALEVTPAAEKKTLAQQAAATGVPPAGDNKKKTPAQQPGEPPARGKK